MTNLGRYKTFWARMYNNVNKKYRQNFGWETRWWGRLWRTVGWHRMIILGRVIIICCAAGQVNGSESRSRPVTGFDSASMMLTCYTYPDNTSDHSPEHEQHYASSARQCNSSHSKQFYVLLTQCFWCQKNSQGIMASMFAGSKPYEIFNCGPVKGQSTQ
jgi:hypothetical protein